jgi:phosphoglycerate dehydrogenase-like enzyme
MKIFVSNTLNVDEKEQLISIGVNDEFFIHGEFCENAPPHPDFLNSKICFGNVPVHWISSHPSLEWIQLMSVGFGEYLEIERSMMPPDFRMTNLAGFFAEPVAESMLAGLLALLRGINMMALLKEESSWEGDSLRGQLRTLEKSCVVLYGYGSINRRFAEILEPFHCKLEIINRSSSLDELDQVLPTADVVASTVPDTPQTRKVFDSRRLEFLKCNTIFLNFGRGSVLDENALGTKLIQRKLGGAVIDVTIDEPLPPDHVFWKCPQTIITQHSAGGTSDEIPAKISWFANNLKRFCKGEKMISEVNLEKGY